MAVDFSCVIDYLNKHGADESRINNDSRIEITIKAIKKANEIYNEKYSISQ